MKKSKLISALAPLTPSMIIDIQTGESVPVTELNTRLTQLITYVKEQAEDIYEQNKERILLDVEDYKSKPNSFGRQKGYSSSYKNLPQEVKAKSRINELVLYKLVSETSSYVKSDNPDKKEHKFGSTINLGAVDSQMASLSIDIEDQTLNLLFKCWDKEYYIQFKIPSYVLKYDIKKWSLPLVRLSKKGAISFIFSVEENIPQRAKGSHKAGFDQGRVEPFVLVVINEQDRLVASYKASARLKQLDAKRGRLLSESCHLKSKIDAYEALGLDSSRLVESESFVSKKISTLSDTVGKVMGHEVSSRLVKHWLNSLNVEDLSWVSGTNKSKIGSSSWSHSEQQVSTTHSLLRRGIKVQRVSPKSSSQLCHKCGEKVRHRAKFRSVYCVGCKLVMDRDFNAAMNMASLKHLRCPPTDRVVGNDCSSTEQVMEYCHTPNSTLGYKRKTTFPT